jgi:hypothetical protein
MGSFSMRRHYGDFDRLCLANDTSAWDQQRWRCCLATKGVSYV